MFKKILVGGMVLVSLFVGTTTCNMLENEWINYNEYVENVAIDHALQDMENIHISVFNGNEETHIQIFENEEIEEMQVKTLDKPVQEIIVKHEDFNIYSIEVSTKNCNEYYKANTYSTAIELAKPLFVSESKCQEMLEQGNKYHDHYTDKAMVEYNSDYMHTTTTITLHDYVGTF